MVKTNRDIDAFLLSGEFEIEFQWGISQLENYLNELNALQMGVPFDRLGIAERRADSKPTVWSAGSVVEDPKALRNPAATPPGSIAHLKLSGVMRSQSGLSTQGVDVLTDDFRAAFQNQNIEGILLEINSGGGESLAGSMLQGILQDSPKAVVVWGHLVASAAMRAAAPADEIIASSSGSMIGSIGTFVTLPKGFSKWYAENYQEVYADKSSKKNEDWRAFIEGDLAPMKASINKSNEIFLQEIASMRPLTNAERALTGELFDAKTAKKLGLVDGIGGFQYAMNRLEANMKKRKQK